MGRVGQEGRRRWRGKSDDESRSSGTGGGLGFTASTPAGKQHMLTAGDEPKIWTEDGILFMLALFFLRSASNRR